MLLYILLKSTVLSPHSFLSTTTLIESSIANMIGYCRLMVYGIAVTFSTFLSILSTYRRIDHEATDLRREVFSVPLIRNLKPNLGQQQQQEQRHILEDDSSDASTQVLLRKVLPTTPIKPVIAPWTKLIRKNGHSFPRSFVFSEVTRLDDYGLKLRKFDDEQREKVKKLLLERLCKRSARFATTKYEANKCDKGLEVWKCASCSEVDGSWYVASSKTGSVFGKAEQTLKHGHE